MAQLKLPLPLTSCKRNYEVGSKVKSVVGHPGYAATNLQASSTGVGDFVTYLGHKIIAQTSEDGTLGILICALQVLGGRGGGRI